MFKLIDAEFFTKRLGRAPAADDLDRCNCPSAGEVGHFQCGWCARHDEPHFQCGCMNIAKQSPGQPTRRSATIVVR